MPGYFIAFEGGEGAGKSTQEGRLAESLATTGQFTRYAGTDTVAPEVIRTPGYPAFVAVIYKLFGVGNNTAVAIAQAAVFAAISALPSPS